MTRIDHLFSQGQTFSFELMPPKARHRHQLEYALPELEALRPFFVTVTYGAGGSTREGTFDLVSYLTKQDEVTTMAHLTAAGQSRQELVDLISAYQRLGLQNLLLLRGDPPLDGSEVAVGEIESALELVQIARTIGNFCVAVAAHPQGHQSSNDSAQDLTYQAQKLIAADVAITQFFFESSVYFRFLDAMEAHGVDTPIVPGLIIPGNVRQLERMAELAGPEVPPFVHERLAKFADDPTAATQAGVELVVELGRELLEQGAPGIHLYTLNKAAPTAAIFDQLGINPVRP